MRFAILPLAVVAIAQIALGQDSCPTGDAQCDAQKPGSYCKFYQGNRVCHGTDTPCYCTTTPPPPPSPTPSAGPCPDGDAYCQQQTGDPTSYCKAAYQFGPGGGVCQGSDEPCTCGGGPTPPGPTSAGPTSAGPTSAGPTSAGPTSAGPTSAGPTSAGPTSAGPTSAGPTPTMPSTTSR